MRPSHRLSFVFLFLAGCSSSPADAPPTKKPLTLPLLLSSVKDSSGKDYAVRFSDPTAARLYVTLDLSVQADGTIVDGDAKVLDQFALEHAASVVPASGDMPDSLTFVEPLTVAGRVFFEGPFASAKEEVDDVTGLMAPNGLAGLASGGTLTAAGRASIDEGGAHATTTDVTLTYVVQAPEAIANVVVSSAFPGPTYLPEWDTHVGPTQPVTFDSAPTMTVGDHPPFPLVDPSISDPGLALLAGLNEVWDFQTGGSFSGPQEDGLTRTVFFPGGTAWDGRKVEPSTVELAPAKVEPAASLDFSNPTDAQPPKLLLFGDAHVVADPLCESGSCIVLQSPPGDGSSLCTGAIAVFDLESTAHLPSVRLRILGQNAEDANRVSLSGTSSSIAFLSLNPSTSTPGYAFDSGWQETNGGNGKWIAYTFGCDPNVKYLIQAAR